MKKYVRNFKKVCENKGQSLNTSSFKRFFSSLNLTKTIPKNAKVVDMFPLQV